MILGIQTAYQPYSIALIEGTADRTTCLVEYTCQANHSFCENLSDDVQRLCQSIDRSIHDIKAIGVAQGPGGYTSLRLGITVAKTISQLLSIPVYGVSTLYAIAAQCQWISGLCLSVLKAPRQQVNTALFGLNHGKINRLTPDFSVAISTLSSHIAQIKQPIYVIGEIEAPVNQALDASVCQLVSQPLHAKTLGEYAHELVKRNESCHDNLVPMYSHQPAIIKEPS